MAEALREAGVRVEVHHDHFEPDAEDAHWLPIVGQKGWVVLSKDRHFRHNYLEIVAMFKGNVKSFILSTKDITGKAMAMTFVTALPEMFSFVKRFDAPFIANVTETGGVKMAWHRSQLYKALSNKPPSG